MGFSKSYFTLYEGTGSIKYVLIIFDQSSTSVNCLFQKEIYTFWQKVSIDYFRKEELRKGGNDYTYKSSS